MTSSSDFADHAAVDTDRPSTSPVHTDKARVVKVFIHFLRFLYSKIIITEGTPLKSRTIRLLARLYFDLHQINSRFCVISHTFHVISTGEEKLHAIWLKELYDDIGAPAHGEDTERAISALQTIQANCDALIKMNPDAVIKKTLKVAITVEQRAALNIYPEFRDRELKNGNQAVAEVYQRVVDSESQHMNWFKSALNELTTLRMQTVPA